MAEIQNKQNAEKEFWNSWGSLESNAKDNGRLNSDEPNRRDDKDYTARLAKLEAEANRQENLRLIAMIIGGILAICLIVYLLGLIDLKSDTTTAASGGTNLQPSAQANAEIAEKNAADIEKDMAKGGFTSKEAYFSSVLAKQSEDVGTDLSEFSKKIKTVSEKMNVTSLVIASKMDQITKDKTLGGFGIEVVGDRGTESDDVSLISHLNGMTSSVEFFAEGGRVVAHFKDYPPSYCAEAKGAAVCGS